MYTLKRSSNDKDIVNHIQYTHIELNIWRRAKINSFIPRNFMSVIVISGRRWRCQCVKLLIVTKYDSKSNERKFTTCRSIHLEFCKRLNNITAMCDYVSEFVYTIEPMFNNLWHSHMCCIEMTNQTRRVHGTEIQCTIVWTTWCNIDKQSRYIIKLKTIARLISSNQMSPETYFTRSNSSFKIFHSLSN